MPLHRHLQCELALIKSGCCLLEVERQKYRLQSGEVFFVPSGIAHGFLAQKPKGVEFVVLQFPSLDDELLPQLINAPPYREIPNLRSWSERFFGTLLQTAERAHFKFAFL
jgi:gentisate 1,2-dioxygenase